MQFLLCKKHKDPDVSEWLQQSYQLPEDLRKFQYQAKPYHDQEVLLLAVFEQDIHYLQQ